MTKNWYCGLFGLQIVASVCGCPPFVSIGLLPYCYLLQDWVTFRCFLFAFFSIIFLFWNGRWRGSYWAVSHGGCGGGEILCSCTVLTSLMLRRPLIARSVSYFPFKIKIIHTMRFGCENTSASIAWLQQSILMKTGR